VSVMWTSNGLFRPPINSGRPRTTICLGNHRTSKGKHLLVLGGQPPAGLVEALDEVCRTTDMRKNAILEAAIRDKIEDSLDAEDLRTAVREATRRKR